MLVYVRLHLSYCHNKNVDANNSPSLAKASKTSFS